MFEFEWDPIKAAANQEKHGVSFVEAREVFVDPLSVTVSDIEHSHDEDRFVIIGVTMNQKLLVVAFTVRGETIRIISARAARPSEHRSYE